MIVSFFVMYGEAHNRTRTKFSLNQVAEQTLRNEAAWSANEESQLVPGFLRKILCLAVSGPFLCNESHISDCNKQALL